jgi:hypothetical protein
VNFFLAYVGISFCILLIFVYFARKHLYGLLHDSRTLVSDLELPVRKQKYGVLSGSGESKDYGQFAQLDELDELDAEMEHKERSLGETNCV